MLCQRFGPLPRVEHLHTFLWVDWKFNHNRKLMRVILGKCFQLINQSLFLHWKRVKKQKFFLFLFDFMKRISHWILSVEASRCWDFFQNPRRQKYWPFQLRLFSCACLQNTFQNVSFIQRPDGWSLLPFWKRIENTSEPKHPDPLRRPFTILHYSYSSIFQTHILLSS